MKRLAIIDHSLSAAGVEKYLSGLVHALPRQERFYDWSASLYLTRRNTAGQFISWPSRLESDRIDVVYFPVKTRSPILDRIFFPVDGFPGTRKIRRLTGETIRKHGPWIVRETMGNRKNLIESYLARNPADVVYFPFPYHIGRPRLEIPMVITLHDFGFWHFDRAPHRYFRRMQKDVGDFIESSAIIIVSSDFIADEVKSYFPNAAEKIRVIRPGIPHTEMHPTPSDLSRCREKFDLPERFVINVGWIFEHKNQQVIIKAIGELKKRGLKVSLLLVGPNTDRLEQPARNAVDPDVQRLLQVAEEAGVYAGEDFRGLGFVDDLDLECLYREAAALVVSSLYEAGSFPIIEANRSRCPVICSRIKPFMEQVALIDGNAYTFDPLDPIELADCIQSVIEDREGALRKAGQAAQLVHESYSWDKMASRYLDAFEDAIALASSAKRTV